MPRHTSGFIKENTGRFIITARNDIHQDEIAEQNTYREQNRRNQTFQYAGYDDPEKGIELTGTQRFRSLQNRHDLQCGQSVFDALVHVWQNDDSIGTTQQKNAVRQKSAGRGVQRND